MLADVEGMRGVHRDVEGQEHQSHRRDRDGHRERLRVEQLARDAEPVNEIDIEEEHHEPSASTEWMLMGISVGAAAAGIGLAMYFWLGNRPAATNIARSAAGFYRLLLNKYYIDELYDAVVVRPINALSTAVLWKGADAALIDGSVNGVGQAVRGTSAVLRRLQSGSVRAYAASLFLGVVLILGWYLMR